MNIETLAVSQINPVMALYSQGKIEKALKSLDLLIAQYPEEPVLYNFKGTCFYSLKQYNKAVDCYQKAIKINPDYAEAHYNLANVFHEIGRIDAAIKGYEQATHFKPDYPEAFNNLGLVFQEIGKFKLAITSYEKALTIKPDYAEVHSNIGKLYKEQDQIYLSINHYKKSLNINPNYLEAHFNLGISLKDLGQLDGAIACYENALKINPDHIESQSNRLFAFNYSTNYDPEYCLKKACLFGASVSSKIPTQFKHFRSSQAPAKLRIGMVSGDLCHHPVGFFLKAILSQFDTNKFELIAYHTSTKNDALTERIKSYFISWKTLHGLSDETAANLIFEDKVNILLDLSGHTAFNRLPVFAWKPAPIQVSWLGYFATTGLNEMDYLIADPHLVPPKNDNHFKEKICRLPETRWCFTPPNIKINTSKLPGLNNGYITFGCFNNLTKINDNVIFLWAKILRSIPKSQLFLKSKQLSEQTIQDSLLQKFVEYGINPERIMLEGYSSYKNYFAAYHKVDICLDPFPFTGGTTSIEGLWMGVPMLTLCGKNFVSRQGVSILINAGLSDWIAKDEEEYLNKAIIFSSDLKKLATLRAKLREQILASPLFNAKKFTQNFEDALWTMWQQWINSSSQC